MQGLVGPPTTVTAHETIATIKVQVARGKTNLSGWLVPASGGIRERQRLVVLAKRRDQWVRVRRVTTTPQGTYALRLSGSRATAYRVSFPAGRA